MAVGAANLSRIRMVRERPPQWVNSFRAAGRPRGALWREMELQPSGSRVQRRPTAAGPLAWVTDTVLNTRIRNGLLTFCYWWVNGQWYRGATDTSGEFDVAIPPIRTPEETVQAMTSLTGPGREDECE